jgi:Domain of unknown function (DUF4249)
VPALPALALGALLTAGGCSPNRTGDELFDPSDDGAIVVDAVLIVDAAFPSIYLGQAIAPGSVFTRDRVALPGASVRIESEGHVVVGYREDDVQPGRYEVFGVLDVVQPGTEYTLHVTAADGRTATATTRTPERFQVERWLLLDDAGEAIVRDLGSIGDLGEDVYDDPRNRIPYSDGLLEARFPRPGIPGFQVSITSLDPDSDLVVDPDFFTPDELADLDRALASPPLAGEDGTLRLPWLAIFWGGRTMVRIFALDENWYDLIRSSPELASGQTGALAFGGNFGDSFERPIFHVDGGIGLFGSAAVDSNAVFVLPEDAAP